MRILMAALEGITTAIFRSIYCKFFKGMDGIYTPFISVQRSHTFKTRDKREFRPFAENTVPQLLCSNAEDFIWAAKVMGDEGYEEINLNAGCPSGTVVSKKRGSGMLDDLLIFSRFLDAYFEAKEKENLPELSVKTRVGLDSYDEAGDIARLYKRYPFSKIIVHPRIRKDFYKNKPDPEAFRVFYDMLPAEKLVYNGDLFTVEDVSAIRAEFPMINGVMLGRGLLADPFLAKKIRGDHNQKPDEERRIIKAFLEELYSAYEEEMSGERDVLFKMKDIWQFIGPGFPEASKELKTIRKCRGKEEYFSAVNSIFRN